MMEKFRKFAKQISFDIIKLPSEVRNYANKIIIISIFGILVPDILAFALKGAQLSLQNGHYIFAAILLILHFGDRVFESLFQTWSNLQNDRYDQLSTNESTKVILNICNITKSRVFKLKDNIIQMVEQPETIKVTKDYLQAYWYFYLKLPTTIAQVLILIGTLVASIILEIKTASVTEAIIITSLLIICIIAYSILSNKRIKVMREYRKICKQNDAAVDVIFTEIKSCDFISQKDFAYHAERLRSKLNEVKEVNKDQHLKLNKVFIKRSLIASVMMIVIMIIKFALSGEFTLETFFDVVALSSIYSTMLQRISSITGSYESIMDVVIDIDALYDDFNNIHTVYQKELEKTIISTPIQHLSVDEFSVTQDKNGAFELINLKKFILKSYDVIMAYGRTGCGKSTLINMLTGRISLTQSPIEFSNGQYGYLSSIGYQTDKALVNNFVLNEIALTDDLDTIDKPKLFEIIKGLELWDELLRKIKEENLNVEGTTDEDKIFEFLKTRKTREFSSGQMQRLALVKLLYTLDETIQMVALDEPFNRLDDDTCKKCIAFIKEYVLRIPRILIIATHQVEICRPFCNVEISFGENLQRSLIRVNR